MTIAAHRSETPSAVRVDLSAIFVSLELSQSKWLITSLSPGAGEKLSKFTLPASDVAGMLTRFAELQRKAKARTGLDFSLVVIQEAGLDGFWVHRVLEGEGIESHVVDPPRSLSRGASVASRPTGSMARCCCGHCWPTSVVSPACVRWCEHRRPKRRIAAVYRASAKL
jgi:transposase